MICPSCKKQTMQYKSNLILVDRMTTTSSPTVITTRTGCLYKCYWCGVTIFRGDNDAIYKK
jgi:tRNA A37 methylthiotransferase MiaB